MNVQRGKIVSGGRLIVPVEYRRLMGLSDGDTVVMELDGDELRVRPLASALRSVREKLRPYIVEGVSVSDELIVDRRVAAERE